MTNPSETTLASIKLAAFRIWRRAYEAAPPQSAPPPPGDEELPPPVVGKQVNALPKSGTVKIKLPGTNTFVLLDEAPGEVLPVGRGPSLPPMLEALDKLAATPS